MSVPSESQVSSLASSPGLGGGGIGGDPAVLQQVVDDFTYLRDVAWSVCQGLDAVVASASGGGFEGAVADALRQAVAGRVKMFVFNVARAFSLAGEAVAEYKLALVQARRAVAVLAAQAGDAGLAGDAAGLQGRVGDAGPGDGGGVAGCGADGVAAG